MGFLPFHYDSSATLDKGLLVNLTLSSVLSCLSERKLSLFVHVRHSSTIHNDVVALQVLVELAKFLSEVESARLVIVFTLKVLRLSHLALIATVEFQDITKGLLSFCLWESKSSG